MQLCLITYHSIMNRRMIEADNPSAQVASLQYAVSHPSQYIKPMD